MKFHRKLTLVAVFVLSGLSAGFAQMTTKDGKPLTYYGSGPLATTTAGLLQTGNGNCVAWTYLFLDTLKVHGIDTTGAHIKVGYPHNNGAYAILMREWIFPESEGKSGHSIYPYVNVFSRTSTPQDIATLSNMVYCEVRPGETIKGQGGTTPPNQFANHQFACVNGKYYDPSYGTESPDDRDFMLSGYMYIIGWYDLDERKFEKDLDGNGTIGMTRLPCVLYKKHQKNWAPREIENY